MRAILPLFLITSLVACGGDNVDTGTPESLQKTLQSNTTSTELPQPPFEISRDQDQPLQAEYPFQKTGPKGQEVFQPAKGTGDYQAQAYDPNYVPPCTVINAGVQYALSGTATGQIYCYNIQTVFADPVKVIAKIYNQQAGENHDIHILQWDVATQSHVIIASSTLGDNSNEVANAISDDGHYLIFVETIQSSGQPFNIAFEATSSFDTHELNDVGGDAKPITSLTPVSGNIDNFSDIDFFKYHTSIGETAIDVYAQLLSSQIMFINSNGTWTEFLTAENPDGPNENTFSVAANSDVLIAITQRSDQNLNTGSYTFIVQKSNPVINLTNHSVLSYNNNTGNYFNQTMPFFYKKGGSQLASGAYSKIRFLGRLNGSNGPAAYKKIKLNYSRGTPSLLLDNFEEIHFTDANGWFSINQELSMNPLYDCRSRNNKAYEGYPYPIPTTSFFYDADQYSISAVDISGQYHAYVDDENTFWLCSVGAPSNYTYWD